MKGFGGLQGGKLDPIHLDTALEILQDPVQIKPGIDGLKAGLPGAGEIYGPAKGGSLDRNPGFRNRFPPVDPEKGQFHLEVVVVYQGFDGAFLLIQGTGSGDPQFPFPKLRGEGTLV
jgi:hypothetical protein